MKGDVMQFFNDYAKQNLILVNQIVKPAGTAKIMSSADDISSWYEAVQYYEVGRIDEAIEKFRSVKQSAKQLLNIGCCYLRKHDITTATEIYKQAVTSDRHLALGFFMLALTEYLQDNFQEALENFEKTFTLLRGNKCVDYRQLGYKYQLYSCEVLTNLAVVNVKLNKMEKAKEHLLQAFENKAEKRHERIFDAVQGLQSGQPIQLFVPPQSEIFRPSKAAVANIKKKDFLGTSKVISTDSEEDCYACFSGIKDKVIEQKKAEAEIKNKPVEKPRIVMKAPPVQSTPSALTTPPTPKTPPPTSKRISMAPHAPLPSLDSVDGEIIRSATVGCRPNKPLPQMMQPTKALPVLNLNIAPEQTVVASVIKTEVTDQVFAQPPTRASADDDDVEIQLEYRFISKVRLPKGFTVEHLKKATEQQAVPKQVEFRLTDQLGRQTLLTDENLSRVRGEPLSSHTIQCFPADSKI